MPRSRHRKDRKIRKGRRVRPAARYVMARDLQDKHILDTSAWNALLDDQRRDDLVEMLRNTIILPTTLCISEIAAAPDPARRRALLQLVRSLGGDNRPLASPNQLMILACRGYARRDQNLTLSGGGEAQGAWIALRDPALVDDEAQRLAREYNGEREGVFRQMNERLRADLQAHFDRGLERPRSMGALIRHYSRNDDFLYEAINPIYERAVGRALPRGEIRDLIGSLPHWPLFLTGYACAIYQRAIREHGFGHRRNPGQMDLWSAAYLASCEYFVTNDTRQRRALKVSNKYSTRRARIVSYSEWREKVLGT